MDYRVANCKNSVDITYCFDLERLIRLFILF